MLFKYWLNNAESNCGHLSGSHLLLFRCQNPEHLCHSRHITSAPKISLLVTTFCSQRAAVQFVANKRPPGENGVRGLARKWKGKGVGNLSTGKEPTVTGAVIEGDFPRGQRLGRLGQSTAKLYTANVQGNIHHTVPRKFHLVLLDEQFLTLPHTVQKEMICPD